MVLTVAECAKRANVHESTVYRWLSKHPEAERPKRKIGKALRAMISVTPEQISEIGGMPPGELPDEPEVPECAPKGYAAVINGLAIAVNDQTTQYEDRLRDMREAMAYLRDALEAQREAVAVLRERARGRRVS